MQTNVLLSIKPIFAEIIFRGEKRFEFRKTIFKNRNIHKIIVYASAPISKVIGEFEVDDILELETSHLWEKTKNHSGIEKDYFDNYFHNKKIGYAIKVGRMKLYETPLELQKHFKISRPPQSFMYLPA